MKYINKLLLLILIFVISSNIYAFDFEIKSDKAFLINTTDDIILFEKNSEEKTSIASLTKIVTAITVLDNTNDIDKEIIITSEMLEGLTGYSKAGIKKGNSITIRELLYGLMLPSGGDCAQALAISTSGSIEDFVKLMNNEVQKIGAKNSHFSNPVGMDDIENYSTAKDLSLILQYSLKNNTFKEIFEANEYYINALNKSVKKTLSATSIANSIDTSLIKGAKTGWTNEAGRCLATTSTLNNIDYILIVLNANENSLDYINDTVNIYDYYKNNYEHITIANKGDILYTLKVKDSKQKEYNIILQDDITLFLKNDISKENVEILFDGVPYIDDKFEKGDLLGTITLLNDDNALYSTKVYLTDDIKFYNYKLCLFIASAILFTITLTFLIIIKLKKK